MKRFFQKLIHPKKAKDEKKEAKSSGIEDPDDDSSSSQSDLESADQALKRLSIQSSNRLQQSSVDESIEQSDLPSAVVPHHVVRLHRNKHKHKIHKELAKAQISLLAEGHAARRVERKEIKRVVLSQTLGGDAWKDKGWLYNHGNEPHEIATRVHTVRKRNIRKERRRRIEDEIRSCRHRQQARQLKKRI